MLRQNFRNYIRELEKEIMEMGQMVITAIERSIKALKDHDIAAAKQIIADDALVNKKRWDIEERCIDLIATQQPVASDLREIVAVLSVVGELERIGDYAEGIGKIIVMYGDQPPVKPLIDIPRMAEKATDMLKRTLDAFLKRDAKTAMSICNEDDEVDSLHEQIYRELLTYMIEDPKTISRATYLIWVSHNLERIADRVTNICERIVFLATGSLTDIKVSRY